MKTYKSKKLAIKVTAKIACGLLLVFIALIAITAGSIKNDLEEKAQDKLTLLSTENASVAREFMESMLNQQTVLINTIKNLKNVEGVQKLQMLHEIISDTKAAESNALSLFYIAEPNTLIKDSLNGYAIFATSAGTQSEPDMYKYVNKELYEQVKSDKQMTVVDPFSKSIDGVEYMVITVILPVLNAQNEFIGVVGSNIDTAILNQANYNHGGFSSFATQIICGHQTVITNSKTPESIGKPYLTVSDSSNSQKILDTAQTEENLTFVDTSADGTKYYKSYIPFYLKGSSVVWLSGASITKAEFDKDIFRQVIFIAIWLVAGFIILIIFTYICIDRSLRPIHNLEQAVKELSKGNLHYQLDYKSNDELGSLADSLRTSTSILHSYITDIGRAMAEMADGNFDLGASQPFIGDFKNIEDSIDKFMHIMSSTLLHIRMAAEQVSAGSEQVSDGAQALAQSATQQAGSVDVLSAEITEVSAHIRNNAENASDVNELAGAVGGKIHTSNERMTEMSVAMSDISKSSEEISKIIKAIEDIAFQTNILALNAAVEAARAGAAGKGFAVVADEVRSLATKSSEAAKQTGALIEGSVRLVRNGVQITQETAESLVEVVAGAEEITKLIEKISLASAEQTESITEITRGVTQISAVVQTNSATSEESAAASEELSSLADVMKSLVSKFKLKKGVEDAPTFGSTPPGFPKTPEVPHTHLLKGKPYPLKGKGQF